MSTWDRVSRRRFLAAAAGTTTMAVSGCLPGSTERARADADGAIKAIDTAEPAPEGWFGAAYDAGFRLYIASTTNVDRWPRGRTPWGGTQDQFKMAMNAGLMIAAYSRDPSLWKMAIDVCGPYAKKLQFFAFDIEDPGSVLTNEMVNGVKSLGVRPLVYSAEWCWSDIMGGDVTSFSYLPLWHADSDPDWAIDTPPSLTIPTPVEFGGWNTPMNPRVGVQQGKELVFEGKSVDVNSFSRAFVSLR